MRLSFLQSRSSAPDLPNQVNHSLGAYKDTEAVRVVRVVRVENNKVCNAENKQPSRISLEFRFKANKGKAGGVIIGDGGLVETVRSLIARYGSRVDFDDLHIRMVKRFALDDVEEAEKLIYKDPS